MPPIVFLGKVEGSMTRADFGCALRIPVPDLRILVMVTSLPNTMIGRRMVRNNDAKDAKVMTNGLIGGLTMGGE